jgi:hypothetical protein
MLKYIELPHMTVYKRRWVRRLMIPITIPHSESNHAVGA